MHDAVGMQLARKEPVKHLLQGGGVQGQTATQSAGMFDHLHSKRLVLLTECAVHQFQLWA